MEQSEMEVETSETALAETGVPSPRTTPSLPEKSSGSEPSSTVGPSSQASPIDKTEVQPNASSLTNTQSASSNEETPQSIPTDHSTNSQAVSLDQTSVSPSAVLPHVASTSKVPSVPGPSSEASPSSVASKLTNGPASKKQRLDYNSMSTGVYLDSTVVPILHLALVTLDRLRPEDPVQYVIDFLLRHKAQYSKGKEHPAPSASTNQA